MSNYPLDRTKPFTFMFSISKGGRGQILSILWGLPNFPDRSGYDQMSVVSVRLMRSLDRVVAGLSAIRAFRGNFRIAGDTAVLSILADPCFLMLSINVYYLVAVRDTL